MDDDSHRDGQSPTKDDPREFIVSFVSEYRATHGVGPTWSEVAVGYGIPTFQSVRHETGETWSQFRERRRTLVARPRRKLGSHIKWLLRNGLLTGGGTERGLDVTEVGVAWLAAAPAA